VAILSLLLWVAVMFGGSAYPIVLSTHLTRVGLLLTFKSVTVTWMVASLRPRKRVGRGIMIATSCSWQRRRRQKVHSPGMTRFDVCMRETRLEDQRDGKAELPD
jgi:hypothetical protein